MKRVAYLLLLVLVMASCKSSKTALSSVSVAKPEPVHYLSSKMQLTFPTGSGGSLTAGGSMKMKSGERVQLSVLMPILRSEMVRLEITPDDILLIDRMNKRYVRASRAELNNILPKDAKYSKLEKLLQEAALPGGKGEVSGKELGIPSLEKANIRLYDFSSQEFEMIPTEVSDRYTQVPLPVLLDMLANLTNGL